MIIAYKKHKKLLGELKSNHYLCARKIQKKGNIMVKVVKCSWEKEVEKVDVKEVKEEIKKLSERWFDLLVEGERENIIGWLKVKFSSLMIEDIEEVYDDGCMVLWGKVNEGLELKEESLVGYLKSACWRIAMHYLRKIRNKEENLDEMMNGIYNKVERKEEEVEMMDLWDVMEEEKMEDNERMKKLDDVWDKLGEVDRMILESYYCEDMKMEEIAKKIGYKTSNSVKSRKNKIMKKMMEMMKGEKKEKINASASIISMNPKINRRVA